MKVGMTGNRTGISDSAQMKLFEFLDANKVIEVHHGDCIGADAVFHDICVDRKIMVVIHPPDVDELRAFRTGDISLPPKKYLARNHNIVKKTDVLIAFPSVKKEVLRSGTWSTIRYAKKINKKVLIIYPDGEIDGN